MNPRKFKNTIYKEMSVMTKALGNPHRLEILDLLAQGPAPVEYIAKHTGLSIANTSQHLQVLKNSTLAINERNGKYIYYSLASQSVFRAWCALRKLGFIQNSEVSKLFEDYRSKIIDFETITAEQLIKKMDKDEVVVLDVRPEEEYKTGHINRALSYPQKNLYERLKELAIEKEIVAYCRGPLCLMADQAVELLNTNGYKAKRLEGGFPDWKMEEYPIDNPDIF